MAAGECLDERQIQLHQPVPGPRIALQAVRGQQTAGGGVPLSALVLGRHIPLGLI